MEVAQSLRGERFKYVKVGTETSLFHTVDKPSQEREIAAKTGRARKVVKDHLEGEHILGPGATSEELKRHIPCDWGS